MEPKCPKCGKEGELFFGFARDLYSDLTEMYNCECGTFERVIKATPGQIARGIELEECAVRLRKGLEMERQLDNITNLLKELDTTDQELAHIEADNLLVQALSLIAYSNGLSEKVDTLIAHYESVPKWYA